MAFSTEDSTSAAHCLDLVGGGFPPSSICALLPQDLLLTGTLRSMLIQHFFSSTTVEEPDLRHLIWQKGETTDILIESVHAWKPETTQHRPGILIKRNDCEYHAIGIGSDARQGPPADLQGDPHYVRLWIGSHTIFCIGQTGTQTELLAAEVQKELSGFGVEMARSLGLIRFRVLHKGAVGELEEAAENFVVPITVGYCYEDRVIVRLNAPRLHAISLSLILEA